MTAREYLDKILPILSLVKEDQEKLARILVFLESDILPELEGEEETIILPKQLEAVVNSIAQSMECNMVCYLNMDNAEMDEIPANIQDEALWKELAGEDAVLKYSAWKNVLVFEPLESFESFRIMADFAGQVADPGIRNRMNDILNRKKPFAHFNQFIHNSSLREDWFAFRNAVYEQHVRQLIFDHLDKDK